MNRTAIALGAAALLAVFAQPLSAAQNAGWITLFDGKTLDNWTKTGDANWRVADGALQADKGGMSYLVSKESYGDFEVRAEFWVDDDANSGIFLRCADPKMPSADACYEVNIFDKRPELKYATGAIVNVAAVTDVPKAGGKWNTYDITARGQQLTVTLNGMRTVDVRDAKHARGPIALQYGAGIVKFRKVEIRSL